MNNSSYQENEINSLIAKMYQHLQHIQDLNDYHGHCEPGEEYSIERDIETYYYRFNNSFKKLYILSLSYLEQTGNSKILKLFIRDLEKVLGEDYQGVISKNYEETGDTYYISEDFQKTILYLSPFPAFNPQINKNIGLLYLENILDNTEYIISKLNVNPNTEVRVYKAVEFVIKSSFPQSIAPSEAFIKPAKCYKPDILIPSLGAAVEYKYAPKEKILIDTIEQIHVDVYGYSNHPIYKIFYAVFYVKSGVCSKTRFDAIWSDQKFPNNWKPVIIFGK